MDDPLQMYDALRQWRSPILRPFSFACVAQEGGDADPTVDELNSMVRQLPKLVSASFFEPKGVVDAYPVPPNESDFDTGAEYDDAYDAFWPKYYDPKPWLIGEVDCRDIPELLSKRMGWNINNKRYRVTDKSGNSDLVAFSRDPAQQIQIETQEKQHQELVGRFLENATALFDMSNRCAMYSSDHLFDNSDERADCCYYDQTIILANPAHRLLVWTGRIRHYG